MPIDSCRKISVNLVNLKDDKGRCSETPHFTMLNKTGGSSRLGGMSKPRDLKNLDKERFSHRLMDIKNIEDEPTKKTAKSNSWKGIFHVEDDDDLRNERKVNHNHYKDK